MSETPFMSIAISSQLPPEDIDYLETSLSLSSITFVTCSQPPIGEVFPEALPPIISRGGASGVAFPGWSLEGTRKPGRDEGAWEGENRIA